MKQYFLLRKKTADEGLDFLFKTPFNGEVNPFFYIGEVDEDEYISWRPVEKTNGDDSKSIEEMLKLKIHQSVIEYFNSYWFVDLDGFINDHYVKLESVTPNIGIKPYSRALAGYKKNHNNKLEHTPIGIEGDGLIVVVDNKNGSVYLEDFERSSFEVLSESIEHLILSLRLKR